jgi:hypothetical protein
MHYFIKKLENCFADAENYEYQLTLTGEHFYPLLVKQRHATVRVNEKLRQPVFIATLPDGVRVKGILTKNFIRVGYLPDKAAAQKATFERWLRDA